ncbi:MAG: hypothetical protein EPN88_09715 [Bacteroidetes bacterium]|nr:MAG: hypothetical protein EPN88_09715 [Bacteroidota bacterium]
MKKKNALKKAAIKLDLEKIEIDVLSDSMLNGLQGGYLTQPGNNSCIDGICNTEVNCSFGCPTQLCSIGCTRPSFCICG